jgi:hypothetical protein
MKKALILMIALTWILSPGISEAVQTKLVIRAKAKDAKFIGTSMGGALVTIKNAENGEVLARGLTMGSTGNTKKIMIDPLYRYGSLTDESTAKFETTIDIDEPTLVTIEVEAPYGKKPDTITSSTQIWLIPGKHIDGEGLIIEIPGFSIEVNTLEQVKLVNNKAIIPIQAYIIMI